MFFRALPAFTRGSFRPTDDRYASRLEPLPLDLITLLCSMIINHDSGFVYRKADVREQFGSQLLPISASCL